ncbi:MAG: LacI family DNA-binding transcriptional regulator [Opitutales bacterium]
MASPTLQTLADLAGVSKSTVSMALRNHPNVASKTRERIQTLAREQGYRPNPQVAHLMAHIRNARPADRQAVIAFLSRFPSVEALKASSRERRESYEGAVARADRLGYRIDHFTLEPTPGSCRRISEVLQARGIRTVILGPQNGMTPQIELAWECFSIATLGFSAFKPAMHRAVRNAYMDMHLALKRLRQSGHRRIGLVIRADEDQRTLYSYSAALLVLNRHLDPAERVPVLSESAITPEAFLRWVETNEPDAIVSFDGREAGWLEEAGIRVPRDLSLVNLCLDPATSAGSGVCPHWGRLGGMAVDLAVATTQRNETGIPTDPGLSLVHGYWVDGASHRVRGPDLVASTVYYADLGGHGASVLA